MSYENSCPRQDCRVPADSVRHQTHDTTALFAVLEGERIVFGIEV